MFHYSMTTREVSGAANVQIPYCFLCLKKLAKKEIVEVSKNSKNIPTFQHLLHYITGTDPCPSRMHATCGKFHLPVFGSILPPLCTSCYDLMAELNRLHNQLLKIQGVIHKEALKAREIIKGTQFGAKSLFEKKLITSGEMLKVEVASVAAVVTTVHQKVIRQQELDARKKNSTVFPNCLPPPPPENLPQVVKDGPDCQMEFEEEATDVSLLIKNEPLLIKTSSSSIYGSNIPPKDPLDLVFPNDNPIFFDPPPPLVIESSSASRKKQRKQTLVPMRDETLENSLKKKTKNQDCDICGKRTSLENLPDHLRNHLGRNGWKCVPCEKIFATKSRLLAHLNHVTNLCKENPAARFDLYKQNTCPYCQPKLNFDTEEELKAHLTKLHEDDDDEDKVHWCKICNLKFSTEYSLDFHFNEHLHPKHLKNRPIPAKFQPDRYKCSVCSKRFDKEYILPHLIEEHGVEEPVKCKLCDYACSHREGYLKHLIVDHKGNEKPCDLCEEKFEKIYQLRIHLFEIHKFGEEVGCETCGKKFLDKRILEIHQRNSHKDEEKYLCELCEKDGIKKTLASEENLQKHMLRVHCNNRVKCQRCFAGFRCQFDLMEHEKQEHAQEPLLCASCGSGFPLSVDLKDHTMKMHGNGKKAKKYLLFQCDICSKRFYNRHHLATHQATHSGEKKFECKHCGKKFKGDSSRKDHELNHLPGGRPRPYVCEHCSRRFFDKFLLEQHIRTHTGERPFVCPYCGDTFRQKETLRAHENSHKKNANFKGRGPLVRGVRKKK